MAIRRMALGLVVTGLSATLARCGLFSTAPAAVSGFAVDIGGGSGEVFVRWERGPESDDDHHNLWYSEFSGNSKMLLDSVAHEPDPLGSPAYDVGSGVTGYIEFPRDLSNDKQRYEISAVSNGGDEGPRTPELCLTDL
jgi:hypothetical protein